MIEPEAIAAVGAGAEPHQVDRRLLGLEIDDTDPTVVRFELVPKLCRGDGALFGGTALAVSLVCFELATSRPALWATVQFVGIATEGERFECRTTVVARGTYVDQVQLTATVADRLVFSASGSTATPRAEGISGQGRRMPRVEPPEGLAVMRPGRAGAEVEPMGHYLVSEFRQVPAGAGASGGASGPDEPVLMWARVVGETETTAAKLGFLADMVPLAVCRAAGAEGAGTSLDNSLRVGRLVDTEWVLVELEAHTADAGYGYGLSHMWAPDGTLMATGSQTSKLFTFESFLRRSGARPVT
ncbi:MAG: acyl-CoA thioesterase [Acidimicrobiales bacterium]